MMFASVNEDVLALVSVIGVVCLMIAKILWDEARMKRNAYRRKRLQEPNVQVRILSYRYPEVATVISYLPHRRIAKNVYQPEGIAVKFEDGDAVFAHFHDFEFIDE